MVCSGFHEAIGDVISLSLTSRIHLRRMHLLPNLTMTCQRNKPSKPSTESDFESKLASTNNLQPPDDIENKLEMNSLYMIALRKVNSKIY